MSFFNPTNEKKPHLLWVHVKKKEISNVGCHGVRRWTKRGHSLSDAPRRAATATHRGFPVWSWADRGWRVVRLDRALPLPNAVVRVRARADGGQPATKRGRSSLFAFTSPSASNICLLDRRAGKHRLPPDRPTASGDRVHPSRPTHETRRTREAAKTSVTCRHRCHRRHYHHRRHHRNHCKPPPP